MYFPSASQYSSKRYLFELWAREGYSFRQLSAIKKISTRTLRRIIYYWLDRKPPALLKHSLKEVTYLLFDATHFGKNGCLCVFTDSIRKKTLSCFYAKREHYEAVYPVALSLKERGLNPVVITLDGHKSVTAALLDVWPNVMVQRCLFHIQRQGLSWLRLYPKTEAAKELKQIFLLVMSIHSFRDKELFLKHYRKWYRTYKNFIKSLPQNSADNKDLKKTMGLLNNALPDMFHYLENPNITPTTNYLEGFFSHTKHRYRSHKGLSKKHKIQYLKWYCFFKNQ